MTSEEKECFSCGAAAPEKNPKKSFTQRFRTLLNVLFIFFAVATLASILAPDYAPSLWKSGTGLLVLYLVKNSADNMSENAIVGDSNRKKADVPQK
jgi:hypothetical protein